MENKQLINEKEIIENFNNSNNHLYLEKEKDILYIKSKNNNWKPFYIEFNSLLKRLNQKETIIKAFGIKKNYKPNILDTTAGLGRDSFILASQGCYITMIERNPIIYILLNNALKNSINNSNLKNIIKKMNLIYNDSINFLLHNKIENIDIIYIDTMFPKTNKDRLVKKNMQIFQNIIENDTDDKELLNISLKQNVKKVIVKRLLKMNYINNLKPNFEIKGTKIRFDIYIP